MSHGKSKRRGGGHEEEHENHERWAVSYADMMTVLMALFLVLFAMSNVDKTKYLELRTSLAEGFGNEALTSDGGSGIESGSTDSVIDLGTNQNSAGAATVTTTAAAATDQQKASQEVSSQQELQAQVEAQLKAQGLQDQVTTTITERGLVISVAANNIFFANGSAAIEPAGDAVIDAIAPVVASHTNDVRVEGHTNNLALSAGSQYATNWDLSGARATQVLLRLLADGVAGSRLESVGYGDQHPLFPDSDPRAVEGNRRVDIVLRTDASDAVQALVPAAAAAATAGAAPAISVDAAPALGADAAPTIPTR